MELPGDLSLALDEALAGISARRLSKVVADLSTCYRTSTTSSRVGLLHSPEEVAAYAAARLPATFAAIHAALSQIQQMLPAWRPETFLDVGAGPGTAMWSATRIWPSLRRITLLDRDEQMIAFGKRLAKASPLPAVKQAAWLKADLARAWELPTQHLVMAAYVIGWFPDAARAELISHLWKITDGALVLIEPGTPAGFLRIKAAREQLLASGAHAIAPCPHNNQCPMTEENWCHFAQRVARSRLHRQVKGGNLSYEDEKFAFVVLSHLPGEPIGGRIVRHPRVQKSAVQFEVCAPEGLVSTVVTRREGERFHQARKLHWGAALPASGQDDQEQR